MAANFWTSSHYLWTRKRWMSCSPSTGRRASLLKISCSLRCTWPIVSGPSGQMTWIRGGPKCLDARNITQAINNSYVLMFGETKYDSIRKFHSIDIEEQLDALGRAVDAGKIRYVGLSNETQYGVMKFLHIAKRGPGYPKILSVQNSYNLLCQNFDCGLAECCHHERTKIS